MGRILRRALLLSVLAICAIGAGIALEGRPSGWAELASLYPGHGEENGLRLAVREGGLGNPRWYHGVAPLRASLGLGGLRLSYPFPYSLGHRPLLIPWRELRVLDATLQGEETWLLLSVAQPERARISLKGGVAEVVREWIAPAGR